MILLLGGTTETAAIANGLSQSGLHVLVSTLTETPLDRGTHPNVQQRVGALDAAGMQSLIKQRSITGVVDATHPYAAEVTKIAASTCRELNIPYCRFSRPGRSKDDGDIHAQPDHQTAAEKACALGSVILLTVGSRHLEPYVEACRRAKRELFVRVLPCEDSLSKCRALGIPGSHVIAERGPFSIEENVALIEKHGVTVLVTKDSGEAGGVPEKIAAAKLQDCAVVLVERPAANASTRTYDTVETLIAAVVSAHSRPFRIGTTSFILKDDILPNVQFLAEKVDDVELLVFESEEQSPLPGEEVIGALASLAAQHALSYTVHLPLDAWIGSSDEQVRLQSVAKHTAVIRRFEPLQPHGYILHVLSNGPTADLDAWRKAVGLSIAGILETGVAAERLCVEMLDYPFAWIEPVVRQHGLSICMDLGHLLDAGKSLTEAMDLYLDRTAVVHLHGVGERDHQSLAKIPSDLLSHILSRLANETTRNRVLTMEVFDRAAFEESLALVEEYMT